MHSSATSTLTDRIVVVWHKISPRARPLVKTQKDTPRKDNQQHNVDDKCRFPADQINHMGPSIAIKAELGFMMYSLVESRP